MVMISDYRLVKQDGFDFVSVITSETSYCPMCGEALFVRGWRLRGMIDIEENRIELLIRRLLCSKCERVHHELPDCLIPYKRHCAETIEGIVSESVESVPCEERTKQRVRAWWRIILPYLLNILKSLAEKYKIQYPDSPAFREMIRAAVNSNNWILPTSLCTRSVCVSR